MRLPYSAMEPATSLTWSSVVFLLHAWNLGLCSACRLGFDRHSLVGLQIQETKGVRVSGGVRVWAGDKSDG